MLLLKKRSLANAAAPSTGSHKRGKSRLLSETHKRQILALLDKEIQLSKESQLAWLAGLIDGEGCVYLGAKRRRGDNMPTFLGCWVGIEMTHRATIERAATLMRELSKDPIRIKERDRPLGTKRQYIATTSSQLGALQLLVSIHKYLIAKRLEALLIIDYLLRATSVKYYKATALDRRIAKCVKSLKKTGYDRAELVALRLLRRSRLMH